MDDNRTLTLLKQVRKTISENNMLDHGDAILVGVSGGPDSVALIHVLHELKEVYALTLGVAHLNHLLRMEESDRDEAFVGRLANSFRLPFFSEKIDVHAYRKIHKLSIEDGAREVRYRFLNTIREREGFQKIAVGHTADDNAELVLMQLLRGAGGLGLSGMAPVRNRKLIRPLIHTLKKEVLSYLSDKKIGYVMDQSNEDMGFTRNRVRKVLLPLIESSFNPNAVETLNRFSAILRCEEEWIREMAAPVYNNSVRGPFDGQLFLEINRFSPLHMALKRRLIRMAIEAIATSLKGFTLFHVDAVIGLSKKKSGASLDLPHGLRVATNGVDLTMTMKNAASRNVFSENEEKTDRPFHYFIERGETAASPFFIPERRAYLTFSKTTMEKVPDFRYASQTPFVAYLNGDILTFPLCVRSIRPGDRFSPLGMTGTQKLKKFFINQKVHPEERKKGFVVESGGRIVWVAGHRPDHTARLMPDTQNVLKIEVSLA